MSIKDTLDIRRIKSIIEYNMRKYRLGGIKYNNDDNSTDDPEGIRGLENDRDLDVWDNQPLELTISGNDRYAYRENNITFRDFLANVIKDIFSNSTSDGDYTKINNKLYNITPSVGSSVPDSLDPFRIQRGNYILEVSSSDIRISSDNGINWKSL